MRASGSREECGHMGQIDSEMAGWIGLKFGGMIESMGENFLIKIRGGSDSLKGY